ncbi:MAG TPA: hypothetical protein VIV66_06330, partial [Pyrinomonadaceae bacterium]
MSQQIKFSSTPSAEVIPDRRWSASSFGLSGVFAGSLDWIVFGTLVLLIFVGLGLRLNNLGAIGFAEDEMNKLDAIHAYEQGDIA